MPAEPSRAQIETMCKAFRESKPVRVVVQGHHRGGSVMWLSLAITPISDEPGKASLFVGIATDITQTIEDARVKHELQKHIETTRYTMQVNRYL